MRMASSLRNQKSSIELSNRSNSPKTVIVEPWAEELVLLPSETWLVVCESPEVEPIPVDLYEDAFIVHGVKRSIVRIFSRGEEIWTSFPRLE